MTETQQKVLPFTDGRIDMERTDYPRMAIHSITTSQLHPVEPPKGRRWPGFHDSITQGLKVWALDVDAMTESTWIRSFGIDWHKVAKLVSYQEMLTDMTHDMFRSANDEVFEDGMTSRFSDALHDIVRKYGVAAIDTIGEAIRADDTSAKVAEEAIRQVGYMSDKATHSARLLLLVRSLESPNVRIRDAASIGIEAMEDPAAIPDLKRAIENEPYRWLRQYLMDVLNQLRT